MQTETRLCKTPESLFADITDNVKYGWNRCVSTYLGLFTSLLIMLITPCYSVVAPILFFKINGEKWDDQAPTTQKNARFGVMFRERNGITLCNFTT